MFYPIKLYSQSVKGDRGQLNIYLAQQLSNIPLTDRNAGYILSIVYVIQVIIWNNIAQSLVFCVVFCRWLFVSLSVYIQSLYCLFFAFRFLIDMFKPYYLAQQMPIISLIIRNPNTSYINVREYRRANQKLSPEKLAIQGTQDEETQSKNTTQYVLDTTIRKQI